MSADQFSQRFLEAHPEEAAHALELLDEETVNSFISSLPQPQAARLLQYLTPIRACRHFIKIPTDQAVQTLKRLPSNYAAALIRRMPKEARERFTLHPGVGGAVKTLLRFPNGSAGSIMDSEPLVLKKNFSVRESRKYIKKYATAVQGIIFITNDKQLLEGYIDARELLLANDDVPISRLIRPVYHRLSVRERLDAVLDAPFWQDSEILPVVDRDGKLMGVLTKQLLLKATSEKEGLAGGIEQPDNILLDLAETFWIAMADLLFTKSEGNSE